MTTVASLMDNLKRKRYAPPPKSEGWFSLEEAVAEGQISKELASGILRDGVTDGSIETKRCPVWDESFNRVITKAYFRAKPEKPEKKAHKKS